jgi:hypothetical protein
MQLKREAQIRSNCDTDNSYDEGRRTQVIIDPHSTRSAWRRFPRKRKRKKAPDLAEQWRKEENEKGGTLPPMTSQQSSLELCLATSSRVNTLDDDDIFLSPKKSREGGRGRREWFGSLRAESRREEEKEN